ncbi:iron-sulfur cluster repair di-iron protein [Arenibacter nanhaiticus]|uniref:iron-sulfur cluster repair di-iron protein n=1 Tax=Arenibacter nanhaiticus TaxID=558155 RepID=UPI0029371386|nr:iron-sulfur cluster repair di-iron protein [Arenibacter nanhaiticus]
MGQLVAQNYRTAAIFSKYDIDFCCKGEKTIDEVCLKKGIDTEHLQERLNEVLNTTDSQDIDYQSWSLYLLANHIENTHHQYVRRNIPTLLKYLNKLCNVHGRRHSELYEINDLFKETATHLKHHMAMEETILFPIVRKMTKNIEADINLALPNFGNVDNPISKMMQEHDNEGENFKKIATLSNNFTPPKDACTTYKVAFSLLKEFEADLLLHIHLENTILFPKAIAIEKGIVGNENLAFNSNN